MLRLLIETCVHRRVAVLFITLVIAAFGLRAYFDTPVEAYPDVTNIQVTVITQLPGNAPEEMAELAGDHTAVELFEALQNCQGRSFLLVGHQPLLGDAVATLLGAAGRCEIDLRKSGACSIQMDGLPPKKPAVLNWLLTSKQLRAVGK